MALMFTELSPKIIFRTNRIMKESRWCKELTSAGSTTSHDRSPIDFLENDKRPPVGGDLFLRSQHARLDAAPLVLRAYFGEGAEMYPSGRKFTPKAGTRKGPQSPNYILCSYCKADLEIDSPLDHIFIARRICPECGREFLIEDGKAEKSPN